MFVTKAQIAAVSRSLYRETGIIPDIEVTPDRVAFTIRTDRVTAQGCYLRGTDGKGVVWGDMLLEIDGVRCLPAGSHQGLAEIIANPDWWREQYPYVEPVAPAKTAALDVADVTFTADLADAPARIVGLVTKLRHRMRRVGGTVNAGTTSEGLWVLHIDIPDDSAQVRVDHDHRARTARLTVLSDGLSYTYTDVGEISAMIDALTMPRPAGAPVRQIGHGQSSSRDGSVEVRRQSVVRV